MVAIVKGIVMQSSLTLEVYLQVLIIDTNAYPAFYDLLYYFIEIEEQSKI